MDSLEKAKSEMGAIESFFSNLPGIEGYREKEMRRSADKQFRDSLARRLEARRRKLTALQNDLLTGGGILYMDDMERVVGRLQLLIDRIKTASYGYGPFFDIERVKEDDLDRLAEFDRGLAAELPRLDEAIGGLETAVGSNQGLREAIAATGVVLSDLNEKFGQRQDVIRGVQTD
jgi:hypothetical protein